MEISGARSQVQNNLASSQSHKTKCLAPPAFVDAEGDDVVERFVAPGDGVKHCTDNSRLVATRWQGIELAVLVLIAQRAEPVRNAAPQRGQLA